MNDELRFAEHELSRIASLASKLMTAAKKFADKADHVVVPRERYTLLEQLFNAACEMEKDCTMTRDYKDAIEAGRVTYAGKKYLLNRSLYEAFCEIKARLKL